MGQHRSRGRASATLDGKTSLRHALCTQHFAIYADLSLEMRREIVTQVLLEATSDHHLFKQTVRNLEAVGKCFVGEFALALGDLEPVLKKKMEELERNFGLACRERWSSGEEYTGEGCAAEAMDNKALDFMDARICRKAELKAVKKLPHLSGIHPSR